MRKSTPKKAKPKLVAGSIPAPSDAPPPPDWLDWTGREEWGRMAPLLKAAGRLTDADVPALALYCDAFSRYQTAREQLADNGPVLETDLGGVKANPAAAVVREASATMSKILAAFGCTPADRRKIAVADEAKTNPLQAFKAKYGR